MEKIRLPVLQDKVQEYKDKYGFVLCEHNIDLHMCNIEDSLINKIKDQVTFQVLNYELGKADFLSLVSRGSTGLKSKSVSFRRECMKHYNQECIFYQPIMNFEVYNPYVLEASKYSARMLK